jgi:hypothetical protein
LSTGSNFVLYLIKKYKNYILWLVGSRILDGKKSRSGIRDKHPGSATLLSSMIREAKEGIGEEMILQMALLRSLPFKGPKKSRLSGPTSFKRPSLWISPHPNPYVPPHINNRYINSY